METVWLGTNRIWDETNRIILPESISKIGIADTDAVVFWAYDTEEEAVVISRLQDEFMENDRFQPRANAQVSEQRVMRVPRVVMDDYTGFDNGEQLHFIATVEYAEKDMTLVLPPDVARHWFDDEFEGLFDGGDE